MDYRSRYVGRHPSHEMDGISRRLIKTKALQLYAQMESHGVDRATVYEIGRLLRSLSQPRIPTLSIFPELYVMSIWERERIYKTASDPYLEAELLGPHVGDTVFHAVRLVLEECYGLSVNVPEEEEYKCKWNIFRGDIKVGSLKYDRKEGHRVPTLRVTLAGRTIALCYRPVGLVIETRIYFNPPSMRTQIRDEVVPALREKENEFMSMLKAKPTVFLRLVKMALISSSGQKPSLVPAT
jgi:hypothetical protein